MTNGPDDEPGQQPPPPPPPPSGGGRGLFSRPDPNQPADLEPRTPPPPPRMPRPDPRVRPPAQPANTPPQGTDDNPFLLPNERDRAPVYGVAPPLPVIPLALMVLAIVVGAALFYMSQEDKDSGLILHLNGIDISESTFRSEIKAGIAKGLIACNTFASQPADNIAAGFKIGALNMTVPSSAGTPRRDQKADDASLLLAATIVKESCPQAGAPAPGQPGAVPGAPVQPGQPTPGAPGAQTPAPGQPVPGGQPPGQPVPGSGSPAPAGTPRPVTSPAAPAPAGAAPAATPRP